MSRELGVHGGTLRVPRRRVQRRELRSQWGLHSAGARRVLSGGSTDDRAAASAGCTCARARADGTCAEFVKEEGAWRH